MIRKEVYRRVQQAFKEAGIEFAHREVTVHVPGISDQPPTGEAEPAAGAAPNTVKREEAVKEAAAGAALAVIAEEGASGPDAAPDSSSQPR
jgi:hypothetical protein